jgi:hypothetical protein
MGGWVCNLLVQLLLCLAGTVTLGSKSYKTNYHILLSHSRLSQPEVPGPRIYIPSGQGQGYITTNIQSVSMSWCQAQSRTIDQSLLSP